MSVAALLMSALAVSGTAPSTVTKTIGGIGVGAQRSELQRRLGPPLSAKKTGDMLDPQLTYRGGLIVWLYGDSGAVGMIESRGSGYCTDTGVCAGDPIDRVRARLGTPLGRSKVEAGANHYPAVGEACWLEVFVARGKVEALALRCQP